VSDIQDLQAEIKSLRAELQQAYEAVKRAATKLGEARREIEDYRHEIAAMKFLAHRRDQQLQAMKAVYNAEVENRKKRKE
jgi:peptidoglycan hydrolase CwlO-like protein